MVNGEVGRPKINLDDYFTKIQPFLQLGYSFHKACLYAEIPYTSMLPYYQNDEGFRNRVERERKLPNIQARRNLVNAIDNGDAKISLEWLQAMEKKEFSKLQQAEDAPADNEGILMLREIIMIKRREAKERREAKRIKVKSPELLSEPEND